MTRFTPVNDPQLDAEIRERFARHEANERILEERWPVLLREHHLRWVAVYGDGEIIIADTMAEIDDAVPHDQRGGGLFRYIKESGPRIL